MAFCHSPNDSEAAEPYQGVMQGLGLRFGRYVPGGDAYSCTASAVDGPIYEGGSLGYQTSSLQRFLLDVDQSPFPSRLLRTREGFLSDQTYHESPYEVYHPWSAMGPNHGQTSPEGSIYSSSGGPTWSANQSVCISSPEMTRHNSLRLRSPFPAQQDNYSPKTCSFPPTPHNSSTVGPCIALRDVERFSEGEVIQDLTHASPDCTLDYFHPILPEQVHPSYHRTNTNQDDEHVVDAAREADSAHASPKQEDNDSDYEPSPVTPTKRRRRSSQNSKQQVSSPTCNTHLTCRPIPPSSLPTSSAILPTIKRKRNRSMTQPTSCQPFPCPFAPYGCSTSFASKNEWKRHITSKHICLEFWRCNLCPSSETRGYNDFNRKDLFTQHLRRMHGPPSPKEHGGCRASKRRRSNVVSEDQEEFEQSLEGIRQRCWVPVRSAPTTSSCLFCSKTFSGEGSWQKRLEHVGQHMENVVKGNGIALKDKNEQPASDGAAENDGDTIAIAVNARQDTAVPPPSQWNVDAPLEEWMVNEGLLKRDGHGTYVLGGHEANDVKIEQVTLLKRPLSGEEDADGEDE